MRALCAGRGARPDRSCGEDGPCANCRCFKFVVCVVTLSDSKPLIGETTKADTKGSLNQL